MSEDTPAHERAYRQVLPRPPDAYVHTEVEAGFPRLSAAERADLVSLERITRAFALDPGVPADTSNASAAVIIAFVGEGIPELVLIRRADHLNSNPGTIAFPGGRLEPGETAAEAALREADEEVALRPEAVRILGSLPVGTRASRIERIATFVGLVDGRPSLVANPDEVDEVFLVPLDRLTDPSGYWEETWVRPDGALLRMPFFSLGADMIWGASARMLTSLFERLAAAG